MKKFIKKITHTAKSAVTCVKTAAVNSMSAVLAFNRRAVCGNAGEGYIDTAVKVLIAVVLGALVLAGLYAILNDMYLRDRADSEGKCWPGIKTIASDMRLSRSTVKRALTDLEQHGYLQKIPRYRDNGSSTSNLYSVQ